MFFFVNRILVWLDLLFTSVTLGGVAQFYKVIFVTLPKVWVYTPNSSSTPSFQKLNIPAPNAIRP